MVSYIKTQWFRVLVGLVSLGFMFYYLFQPAADESTLEGFRENSENACAALCFFITAMIWFLCSIIEHHKDRIELLEKKQERDDAMYKLVQELLEANKIDREHMKVLEAKLKRLEDRR